MTIFMKRFINRIYLEWQERENGWILNSQWFQIIMVQLSNSIGEHR